MNAMDQRPAASEFLDALFDDQLLIKTGVDGLYGSSSVFEEVIDRFMACIAELAADDRATRIHFPPGLPRRDLEKSGYLRTFPQLAGCVHAFQGEEADHMGLIGLLENGEDWSQTQEATSVALTPAACYPLYPMVASQGPLPDEGVLYELSSYCFRHEPAQDPARMQMFRMKEFVRIGTPKAVLDFRQTWLDRGRTLIESIGLPCVVERANDPFFGRAGKKMGNNQRDQGLKFELLIPTTSDAVSTACLSFNYHKAHFGQLWGIRFADGTPASSACVGFGLERVALALFRHHGTQVDRWPGPVRRVLWG